MTYSSQNRFNPVPTPTSGSGPARATGYSSRNRLSPVPTPTSDGQPARMTTYSTQNRFSPVATPTGGSGGSRLQGRLESYSRGGRSRAVQLPKYYKDTEAGAFDAAAAHERSRAAGMQPPASATSYQGSSSPLALSGVMGSGGATVRSAPSAAYNERLSQMKQQHGGERVLPPPAVHEAVEQFRAAGPGAAVPELIDQRSQAYAERPDIAAWIEANRNGPKGVDGKTVVDRFLEKQRPAAPATTSGGVTRDEDGHITEGFETWDSMSNVSAPEAPPAVDQTALPYFDALPASAQGIGQAAMGAAAELSTPPIDEAAAMFNMAAPDVGPGADFLKRFKESRFRPDLYSPVA